LPGGFVNNNIGNNNIGNNNASNWGGSNNHNMPYSSNFQGPGSQFGAPQQSGFNNYNQGNFGGSNIDSYSGLDPNIRTQIREILNGLNVAVKKDIEDS
jgi:hypothetical protein